MKGEFVLKTFFETLWSKCSAFYYWFELRLIFLRFLVSLLGPAPKTLRLKWKWKVLIKSTIYLSLKIDPKSMWGLAGVAPGNKLLSRLMLQVFSANRTVKSHMLVSEICKILSSSPRSASAQPQLWGLKWMWPLGSVGQELQVLWGSRRWVHAISPVYPVSELNWMLLAWTSWICFLGYWPNRAVTLWHLRTETILWLSALFSLSIPYPNKPWNKLCWHTEEMEQPGTDNEEMIQNFPLLWTQLSATKWSVHLFLCQVDLILNYWSGWCYYHFTKNIELGLY